MARRGTELGVEGKNFGEGCVVLVGGVVAKTRRVSGSLLEANTPEGDDGKLVDVVVLNPDGQQAIQTRAFQYDARYRALGEGGPRAGHRPARALTALTRGRRLPP